LFQQTFNNGERFTVTSISITAIAFQAVSANSEEAEEPG